MLVCDIHLDFKGYYRDVVLSGPDMYYRGQTCTIGATQIIAHFMKKDTKYNSRRPYCIENAGSHPNSEAKRCKARSVLGWGTAREHHGVDGFFGIAKILDPDSIKLTYYRD